MVRASDFGPIGRGSIPASGCHRMQIGQSAFVTSLPLPTQERAWHDWVVGPGNACVSVSRGRTLTRRVWLQTSHMYINFKNQRWYNCVKRLVVKRYIKTDFTFFTFYRENIKDLARLVRIYRSNLKN